VVVLVVEFVEVVVLVYCKNLPEVVVFAVELVVEFVEFVEFEVFATGIDAISG
jgi:hypothetical protein